MRGGARRQTFGCPKESQQRHDAAHLIVTASPCANALNDYGQVVGHCRAGSCYALRLDPISAVPEPAGGAMLAAGVGVFGWLRRGAAALTASR